MAGKTKADDFNPFEGLVKDTLLQECRVFNDRDIDPKRCCGLITKIMYLLGQGERITKENATNVFFGATKLFHSKDAHLRRMVFLVFRAMGPIVSPEERIIVTATLVNGMKDAKPIFRSNSIRVLAQVIDPAMFGGEIERKLKESIVDNSPVVVSAALVGGAVLHERGISAENIKRWVNEINSALQSRSPSAQLQALALLTKIRKHDRLASAKLVEQITRLSLASPLSQCLRLRLVGKVMQETHCSDRSLYDFVEGQVRNSHDMVVVEAARVLASVTHLSEADVEPAMASLQVLLTSSTSNPTRFAAVRTLNKIASRFPDLVKACNSDLEELMSDPNRSVATLAITTLLKTATDHNVEKLMRRIGGFMTDVSDEFKSVVVQAMRSLCLKFPQRHAMFFTFLSGALREDGGFAYKKMIVDTVCDLIQEIPQAKAAGLMQLGEFIEDCEFVSLSVKVLHVLGQEGPSVKSPRQVVRFAYNRMVLDAAVVRAAAVDCLASLARSLPDLRGEVVVLLTRCSSDADDEVRDRAILHLRMLGVGGGHQDQDQGEGQGEDQHGLDQEVEALLRPVVGDLEQLEQALLKHVDEAPEDSLDLVALEADIARRKATTPAVVKPGSAAAGGKGPGAGGGAGGAGAGAGPGAGGAPEAQGQAVLSLPEVAMCGKLLKSCKAVELTESDSDYVVSCIKHVFARHMVLQFDVVNTIEEQALENVVVECDLGAAVGVAPVQAVPAALVRANDTASTFVVLERDVPGGVMVNTLRFLVKDVDVSTGEVSQVGYEDEYQLEDLALSASDLMVPLAVSDYRRKWESLAGQCERTELFVLNFSNIPDTVVAVLNMLSLAPCEGSGTVKDGNQAPRHSAYTSGKFIDGTPVLCIVNFALEPSSQQVHIRVMARSPAQAVCDAVMASIG